MTKTILFCYSGSLHPEDGGIARVTDLLASEFVRRGYRVLLLSQSQKYYAVQQDILHFVLPKSDFLSEENILFFENIIREYGVKVIVNQSATYSKDAKETMLYSTARKFGAKIVSVIHCIPSVTYAYIGDDVRRFFLQNKKGILKLIFYMYCLVKIPIERRKTMRSMRKFYRLIYDCSDVVFVFCEHFKRDLGEILELGGLMDKIKIMPNPNTYPLPSDGISYETCKSKQVLYVGRLDYVEKRPDTLLEVWKKINTSFPDWRLIYVGDGAYRQKLESLAKGVDNVTFVGQCDPQTFYETSEILCLTSRFEGWGMVIPEAIIKGCIPVAFDCKQSSVRSLIKDDMQLVSPFSIDEYAKKLSFLMSDKKSRKKLQQKGVENIRCYSLEKVVNRWINIFVKLGEG